MNITIITIGKKMPEWINLGVKAYQHRFAKPYTLILHEIPLKNRGNNCDIKSVKLRLY